MDVLSCLRLILQNLDAIPVTGIANQDRMVNCARLLEDVIHTLKNIPEKDTTQEAEKKEEVDG